MIRRRRILTGIGIGLFAPAIIRTPGVLMPIKPVLAPAPTGAPGEVFIGNGVPANIGGIRQMPGDLYLDGATYLLYVRETGGKWREIGPTHIGFHFPRDGA